MVFFKNIKKLFQIIDFQHKSKIFVVVTCIVLNMLLEMIGLGLIIPLLHFLLDNNRITFYVNNYTFLNFLSNYNLETVILLFLIFLLIFYFIKNIFSIFLIYYQMKFAYSVQNNLSTRIYNKYMDQSLEFHIKNNPAKLIQNINLEISYLVGDFLIPTLIILSEFFILCGISIFLLYFNTKVFLLVFIYYLISIIIYFYFTKRKNIQLGFSRHEAEKNRGLILQNSFFAFKDIKIFNASYLFNFSFLQTVKKLCNVATSQQTLQYIPSRIIEIISIFAFVLVIYFMIVNQFQNQDIIITIGIMGAAAFKILPSINRIISGFQSMRFSQVSLKLISDQLSLEKYIYPKHFLIKKSQLLESIEIKNVSFKYSNNSESVFDNLNFKIKRNDFIGLIGKSGSGKSTIINLLLGFLKPQKGEVIYEYNKNSDSYSSVFGYIPQDHFLINDTLISNVALSQNKDDINMDKIIRCLDKVNLNFLSEKLKKDKNFIVEDRGMNLSGGQRQRLAIARAIYLDSQFLIFDEATSALDKETEMYILQFLDEVIGKKTIIWSTHKRDQLKNCHKIYEVKDNKLIEKKLK